MVHVSGIHDDVEDGGHGDVAVLRAHGVVGVIGGVATYDADAPDWSLNVAFC